MSMHIDEYLATQLEQGRLLLFAGAGFSLDAKDTKLRPLPTGRKLTEELWELVYPGEPYDGYSTLQDVFAVSRQKGARQLTQFLTERLTADHGSLPDFYRDWLNVPWRRVYTLNVDDVFQATAQKFELPRHLASINGLSHTGEFSQPRAADALEVVHLNGRITDGLDNVTFSSAQYAERASKSEPLYHQLATDIVAFPVVFVGTPLEEPLLWQYLEMRGSRGGRQMRELRPRSFLITPVIPRAKEDLLASYNVEIIKTTAKEFAEKHLKGLSSTSTAGLASLRQKRPSGGAAPTLMAPVSTAGRPRSLFLLGAEPTLADIQDGLAIARDVDQELYDRVLANRRNPKNPSAPSCPVLLGGTAGSGKSTSLMRLGLRLIADGAQVAWIGMTDNVSPLSLRRWAESQSKPVSILIDDVDRYGTEGARLLHALTEVSQVDVIVAATRSSKMDRIVGSPLLANDGVAEVVMPNLTDKDIDGLLDVLTKDKKLGKLQGRSRSDQHAALRERCGRQLLVAMLEATFSRSFEDKVYSEWSELSEVEKLVYEAVAISYSHRFPLTRSSLLISLQDVSNEVLNVVDQLTRRHIIIQEPGGYRPRHRVVGETLVDRLTDENPWALAKLLARLTFAAAVEATPPADRNRPEWRYLIALMNHASLLRRVGVEGARLVYQEIEDVLAHDHHYWLQRGSLELEEGNVRLAENYLEQARALNPDDLKVQTAYAYMQLKIAAAEPNSTSADRLVREAVEALEEQIGERGRQDMYPYHVLGSQCLSWIRRCPWISTRKEQFLQRVIGKVQEGLANHPRASELRGLLKDLRYDLIALQTGLAPGGGTPANTGGKS